MTVIMYAKLFSSLLSSSIWSEELETRVVFVTMLALADREGYVYGSPVGLAALARLPVEATVKALERLKSPDVYSGDLKREHDRDGRRIEELEQGGWFLLNYAYYRDLSDAETRRAQNREAKRRERERLKLLTVSESQKLSAAVSPSESSSESEAESKTQRTHRRSAPQASDEGFSEWWAPYPKKVGRGDAFKVWRSLSAADRQAALKAAPAFASAWADALPDRHRFIPNPATFLRQQRWTDEPSEWRQQAGGEGDQKTKRSELPPDERARIDSIRAMMKGEKANG